MNKELVSIADMAAATGIEESDVRRFVSEHPGLFTPATSSGRTLYDADVVEVLSRIQELAGAGLSKQEIENVLKRSAGSPSEETLSGQEAELSDSLKEAVKAGVASGIHALVRELQVTNRRLAYLESRLEVALGTPSGPDREVENDEWLGTPMADGHVPHAVSEDKAPLTMFEAPLEEQVPEQGSLFKREAETMHTTTAQTSAATAPSSEPAAEAAPLAGVADKTAGAGIAKDMGHDFSQDMPMVAEPPLKEEQAKTAEEKAAGVADLQKTVAEATAPKPPEASKKVAEPAPAREEPVARQDEKQPKGKPEKTAEKKPAEAKPSEPLQQKTEARAEPEARKTEVQAEPKPKEKKPDAEPGTEEKKVEAKPAEPKPDAAAPGKVETGGPAPKADEKPAVAVEKAAAPKFEDKKAEPVKPAETLESVAERVPTAEIPDLDEEFESIELSEDFFEDVPTIDLEEDAIVEEDPAIAEGEKTNFDFEGPEFDIETATADLLNDLEEKETTQSWEFEVDELEDTGKTLPDFSEDNAEDTWEFDSPDKKTEKGAWAKEPASSAEPRKKGHGAEPPAADPMIDALDEDSLEETQKPVSSDLVEELSDTGLDTMSEPAKPGPVGLEVPTSEKSARQPQTPKGAPAEEAGSDPEKAKKADGTKVQPADKESGITAGKAGTKTEVEPEAKPKVESAEKPGEQKPGTPEKTKARTEGKPEEPKEKAAEKASAMPNMKTGEKPVQKKAAEAKGAAEPKPAAAAEAPSAPKPDAKAPEKVTTEGGGKSEEKKPEPAKSELVEPESAKLEPAATKPVAAKAEPAAKSETAMPAKEAAKAGSVAKPESKKSEPEKPEQPAGIGVEKPVEPAVKASAAAPAHPAQEAEEAESATKAGAKTAEDKPATAAKPVEAKTPKPSAPEAKPVAEPAPKPAGKQAAAGETLPEEAQEAVTAEEKPAVTGEVKPETEKPAAKPDEKALKAEDEPAKPREKAARPEEPSAELEDESKPQDMADEFDDLMAESFVDAEPIFDEGKAEPKAERQKPEKKSDQAEAESKKKETDKTEARRKEEEETADIILEVSEEGEEAEVSAEAPERTIQFNEYNEPTQPPVTPRETRRVIWYMYKRGCELTQIADYLALERVPTFSGRGTWNAERVSQVVKTLERRVTERKQKRDNESTKEPNAMDDLIG